MYNFRVLITIGLLLQNDLILYEIFFGEASQINANSANTSCQKAFHALRLIVTVGWAIYPIGYFWGYMLDGANVEAVDQFGKTAFLWAAGNGHADIVGYLIQHHDATVDIRDNDGKTALIHSSINGHTDTVRELITTHLADVETRDNSGGTALIYASANGHTETVCELITTHGASVEAMDNDGETALMWAARNGHTNIINDLITAHGANIQDRKL